MLTLSKICIPRAVGGTPNFDAPEFNVVEAFFDNAPELAFGQAWRARLSDDFAPARARILGSEDALWVWADLTDENPRNAATSPNQNTWELGDCFEMFLANSSDGSYYEMHVTPENQTLQLRGKSCQEMRPVEKALFRSATWLVSSGWQVLLQLPLELLNGETNGWVSLSRYDYQNGRAKPVTSSTSPHRKLDFHRRQEWTPFELQTHSAS